MAEKTTLAQRVQVGVESTYGEAAAANKVLQSISLTAKPEVENEMFRPAGYKYPTLAVLNKEWSSANVEGKPVYDELQYLLASVLATPTVTNPGGSAQLWTFAPSSQNADTPASFTIENGESGSGNARRTPGNVLTDLDLTVNRGEVTVDGSFLGGLMELGHTLTASPTALPLVPITPGQVCVYMDATAAALGTTKLERNFEYSLRLGSRFNPIWALDCEADSFVGIVEGEPTAQVMLRVAADAVGLGIIDNLRTGDTVFVRMEATGPIISTVYPYRLTVDTALKVSNIGEFGDEDGIYAVDYTFDIVHDATWTRALKVELQNKQTAL